MAKINDNALKIIRRNIKRQPKQTPEIRKLLDENNIVLSKTSNAICSTLGSHFDYITMKDLKERYNIRLLYNTFSNETLWYIGEENLKRYAEKIDKI